MMTMPQSLQSASGMPDLPCVPGLHRPRLTERRTRVGRAQMIMRGCLAGLEGRETEGEAQCALLSLCGERVRGGVLTWEAAR